ncbi:hypothetical protein IF2G_07373 [Cordyceps javanica]|nr:hypothetical protein IF2G_07373 [Cordyceps javanica]
MPRRTGERHCQEATIGHFLSGCAALTGKKSLYWLEARRMTCSRRLSLLEGPAGAVFDPNSSPPNGDDGHMSLFRASNIHGLVSSLLMVRGDLPRSNEPRSWDGSGRTLMLSFSILQSG